MVPTKWPLAKVTNEYRGKDGFIRAVDVLISKGTYRRLVHKITAETNFEIELPIFKLMIMIIIPFYFVLPPLC